MKKAKSPKIKENSESRLDVQTSKALEMCGASNYLQSKYYRKVSKVATLANSRIMYFVQPRVQIPQEERWRQSLIFLFRFLRRYKMENTIKTIVYECPKISNASKIRDSPEFEYTYEELMGISDFLKEFRFRTKVETTYRSIVNVKQPPNKIKL